MCFFFFFFTNVFLFFYFLLPFPFLFIFSFFCFKNVFILHFSFFFKIIIHSNSLFITTIRSNLTCSTSKVNVSVVLVIVHYSSFLVSDGTVTLQQQQNLRWVQAATFQSGCCLSFLSHLDPIGAASFSEGGTHINSQAAVTTLCSTAWMLVHSFAAVPLLHCQLRYGV